MLKFQVDYKVKQDTKIGCDSMDKMSHVHISVLVNEYTCIPVYLHIGFFAYWSDVKYPNI